MTSFCFPLNAFGPLFFLLYFFCYDNNAIVIRYTREKSGKERKVSQFREEKETTNKLFNVKFHTRHLHILSSIQPRLERDGAQTYHS